MDLDSLADGDIANFCSSANPNRNLINNADSGRPVCKLSEQVVVKFGCDVTKHEADAQECARRLVNSEIVRIPKVNRFFKREGTGYIVMEYMRGQSAERVPELHDYIAQRMAKILGHFEQIRSDCPGALLGGVCRGLLWSDYHNFQPSSIGDLESYFNARLRGPDRLRLSENDPLVLSHGDIADRNIMVLDNGELALLDWPSAGFFPRSFEVAALRRNAKNAFGVLMLQHSRALSPAEMVQAELVQQVACSCQRYISDLPPLKPVLSTALRKHLRMLRVVKRYKGENRRKIDPHAEMVEPFV